jgi:hypothetical protein
MGLASSYGFEDFHAISRAEAICLERGARYDVLVDRDRDASVAHLEEGEQATQGTVRRDAAGFAIDE